MIALRILTSGALFDVADGALALKNIALGGGNHNRYDAGACGAIKRRRGAKEAGGSVNDIRRRLSLAQENSAILSEMSGEVDDFANSFYTRYISALRRMRDQEDFACSPASIVPIDRMLINLKPIVAELEALLAKLDEGQIENVDATIKDAGRWVYD